MLRRLTPILAGWLCAVLAAQGATLVLQQGTNGYSGCTDSCISTGGYGDDQYQNFGECGDLILNTEHYNPG
jgi:hypothetical protein